MKYAAALLNGTLYIYGGQSKSTADQKSDTWSKLTPKGRGTMANNRR